MNRSATGRNIIVIATVKSVLLSMLSRLGLVSGPGASFRTSVLVMFSVVFVMTVSVACGTCRLIMTMRLG